MNHFAVLYLKEIKENFNVMLLLWVATVGIGGYAISQQSEAWVLSTGLASLPYGAVLLLPFLLAQSFNSESKGQSNFLLLALPVPYWQIALSKVVAVLTAGSGVFVLATCAFQWVVIETVAMGQFGAAQVQGSDIWFLGGMSYHAFALLLLGVACMMEAVKQVFKGYRRMGAMAVFIACFWIYFKGGAMAGKWGAMGSYSVGSHLVHGAEHVQADIGWIMYTAAMGIAFIGLGLALYTRYVEVD